jgi:hypothetical protein
MLVSPPEHIGVWRGCPDIQHNDIQYNDNQHEWLICDIQHE